ncbi:hypothetical protein DSLASN_40260 [Desulfoluna limicola]|uniref:Uncharacterized protein n=1 Tax=Desulfoluna limicola TaxID=2810562 RepID=A0ABM7PMU8_9BACT|nr:hypothetical protein DSLASN_40260 [Desulfoluna limicola]
MSGYIGRPGPSEASGAFEGNFENLRGVCSHSRLNISAVVTIQLNIASGGPAGGQTFETFDKQVLGAHDKKRSAGGIGESSRMA